MIGLNKKVHRSSPTLVIVLCSLVFLAGILDAAPDNMLSDYSIRRWRGEDGLGADIVNGVEQSLDGYLWCVTQNQVLRFDGQRFSPVDRSGIPMGDLAWKGVAVDHHGALWFYGEGGVFKYDGSTWTPFVKATGRGKSGVFAMEENTKGVMWGASEEGLYSFDGAKTALVPCMVDGKNLPLSEMDVAPDGQIFVIAKDGDALCLFRFNDGQFLKENLPAEYRSTNVLKVHVGPQGTLWVVTAENLLCKSGGVWRALPFPEEQSDWVGIRTILERQGGELWAGTARGLFRWRGGKWSELTTRDGFFPFAVRALKEDREGGLWVAGTGGLMRLVPKSVQVFLTGQSPEKESFISLLESGGEWWAGIAGMKPMAGTPWNFHPAGISAFPENVTASALLKGRDGSLWIGTHSRNLWHWKDGKSEVILPKKDADPHFSAVTALLEDRTGKIWVGTLGGLAVATGGSLEPVEIGADRPKDTVNTLQEDEEGTIWVGYQTLGLVKILRDGSSIWFKKGEGLPDNSVRTIYRDKAGSLWIGTSAGLVHWVKNRQSVFTEAQGLVDDGIRQIIEDDFGCLWLGTRSGLMRVGETEFSAVNSGAKARLAVRSFGHRDGMKSEECTGALPVKTADGKLWFPTADGLVMVDSRALPKAMETPLVYLENVCVGKRLVWSLAPLRSPVQKSQPAAIVLPSQARDVKFRFTTIDYFAPERVRFRYRVEGLDEDWSAPGAARTAYYRKIPHGSYRFRVESCSRDGVWSAGDSSIAFTVPPLFWQSGWFKAVGVAIGILAAVLLIIWWERRRTRRKLRVLRNEQMLERERARIARDIHDEVGAGLTEVALLSELAQAGVSGPEQKYLDDIFKTARDLTRSMDEIVWSINPANDTLEKLVSYLVEFARDFLGTASLPCRLEVPTVVPPITVASTVRHQICLAVKETLNNTVKHSGASEVRMEIEWDAGRLRILIRDDGRGFEREGVEDPAATRDGLDNISARMREIGGSCEQQSGIGKGCCTVLSVEIPTVSVTPKDE